MNVASSLGMSSATASVPAGELAAIEERIKYLCRGLRSLVDESTAISARVLGEENAADVGDGVRAPQPGIVGNLNYGLDAAQEHLNSLAYQIGRLGSL